MAPSIPTCTHDRGRGTTVCLRCRHEQSQASQRRRQRFLMQFLGIASVAALIGVAGIGAASTLRDKKQPDVIATGEGSVSLGDSRAAIRPSAPGPVVTTPAVELQSTPAVSDSTPVAAPAPTPTPVTPAPVARPAARAGYILVEGKTQLTDSIYAIRAGDSVIVNFDAQGYRTRRSDKFEATILATLPLVVGKMATAGFDTVKKGQLVSNRDVTGALAGEGMRVTLSNGSTVRLRALTRVVPSGPLVIGYLAVIDR